ncbi:MAG: type VI secretion system baseplate subunit TssF [Victivallaceae bacterium]|nr:type VI secretion system baseplate subunit TssF [Victivallaceae bacterium]
MTFLDYYKQNLAHIRSTASEFAREFPKIAARLELSEFNCQDPYVERLLEGAAFLSARVEKKLDDGFPRLLEAVLGAIDPMSLYPMPSSCIIELQPDFSDERLGRGSEIPYGTAFSCKAPGASSDCVYTTSAPVVLHPMSVADFGYFVRDVDNFELPIRGVRSAFQLKLEHQEMSPPPDYLDLFVNLPDDEASELLRLLATSCVGIFARARDGSMFRLDGATVAPLLPDVRIARRYGASYGLCLLQLLPRFASIFKYFRLGGIAGAFSGEGVSEIVIALGDRRQNWPQLISREHVRLYAVPAFNVFRKRSDRIDFNGGFEYHVVPDRTAPIDSEVSKLPGVHAYNDRNETLFKCERSYHVTDGTAAGRSNFFIQHREEKLVGTIGRRTSYQGGEVYISFAGEDYDSRWDDIKQFGADLLCTNRDLPLLLRKEDPLTVSNELPIRSAAFLTQPTVPDRPLITAGRAADFEKISHLSFNMSAAFWKPDTDRLAVLRNIIDSYEVPAAGTEVAHLGAALTKVDVRPRGFRVISGGNIYFENGWTVELTINEEACSGIGYFTYASVLRELLFSYVPINTCIEVVLHTDRRRDVMVWKNDRRS